MISPIRARWLGLAVMGIGGLAQALVAGTAHAETTIDSFTTDGIGISPNDDGDFDLLGIETTFTWDADSLGIVLELHHESEAPRVIQIVPRQPVFASPWDTTWAGADTAGVLIPDGVYQLVVTLASADTTASDSLRVRVDTTRPQIDSVTLTGPAGSFRNGDFVQMLASFTEDPVAFELDVSALDDDATRYDQAQFIRQSEGMWSILHQISPDNTLGDGRNRAISLTVTDSLGNESEENRDLLVCLSNVPPVFEAAILSSAFGDTLSDPTYGLGDSIYVEARFLSAFHVDDNPLLRVNFIPNFAELDTEYNPFSNPAVLTYSSADSILPEDQTVSGYVTAVTVRYGYQISDRNARPEGVYDLTVLATDTGCGEAITDPPIRATLAALGPPTPTLDAPAAETHREDTFALTGTAPEADSVIIEDADEEIVAIAELTPDTGRFTATVALEPGVNRFRAISRDSLAHPSVPSDYIAIYRLEGIQIEMQNRYRAGDPILVTLAEPPLKISLDIFNLAGDRISHDEVFSPGELHTFTWDGRNRNANKVLSGPYILRILADYGAARDQINRAFVFTRN